MQPVNLGWRISDVPEPMIQDQKNRREMDPSLSLVPARLSRGHLSQRQAVTLAHGGPPRARAVSALCTKFIRLDDEAPMRPKSLL